MRIEYVPRSIANKFADAFAGKRLGFSAKEISEFFTQYSNAVRHVDFYGVNPTRFELFLDSLYSLEPKQQYYALNDLAWEEKESKYAYPDEQLRNQLRGELHNCISPDPIGVSFSRIRETEFRYDWFQAYYKIAADPAGAVTAARTLLETNLKTLLHERNVAPDNSGDIGKLIKQAERTLGFEPKDIPGEHKVFSGFASIVSGVAEISNNAGDRHGTIAGVSVDDPAIAELCVHACATVGLFFIELHLLTPKIE